jgi:23S rRNA (adenine2503-C2)-methyltransferase
VPEPIDLYGLTRPELFQLVASWDLSPVHAARIWKYLYLDLVDAAHPMGDLPRRVRERLAAETTRGSLPVRHRVDSADGHTRKLLLGLADGAQIETVLMRFKSRATACVSSQAGCAMGCVFCATGQMGYRRHLATAEIVAQVAQAARALATPPEPHRLRNLVFMGMGEPLHNYDAVMKACDILRDPSGLGLSSEHLTISTVGVIPGILRMAREGRPEHLAVSLHAAHQAERAALVPAARKWPLEELMAACRTFTSTLRRKIFFEWTLIEGTNDSAAHAHAVGRLIGDLPAHVNLIPLNPTGGYGGAPSHQEAARAFQQILAKEYAIPSTVRLRRGIDIAAGCGQLAVAATHRAPGLYRQS